MHAYVTPSRYPRPQAFPNQNKERGSENLKSMSSPPYFSSQPDVWIPILNTPYHLPSTWEYAKAIERLARFFARLLVFRKVFPNEEGRRKGTIANDRVGLSE